MAYSEQFMSQRLTEDENRGVIHARGDRGVDVKLTRFPGSFAGCHDFLGKGWGNPGVYWNEDCNSYVLLPVLRLRDGCCTWMTDYAQGGPMRVVLVCINGIGEIRWTVEPPYDGNMEQAFIRPGDMAAVEAFDLFPARSIGTTDLLAHTLDSAVPR